MALAHCGITARVDGVDTENTNEAINCRLFYNHVRDLTLEARPWPFAERRRALTKLGTPHLGWNFRYKYPADCKHASYIENPCTPKAPQKKEDKIPFIIRDIDDGYGKCILTNQDDAILVFNINLEDENLMTSTFVQAFSLGIASHISTPLRVDANIKQMVTQAWTNWLAEASNFAQREQQDQPEAPSQYESARG